MFPLATVLMVVPVLVSGQRGNRDGRPNLEGTWNSGTVTPIERPPQFKDKPFFTPEEVAEMERHAAERNAEPSPEALAKSNVAPQSSPSRPTAASPL